MNIYACLDSDNEDEPQVQKPKKEEKKKPAAPAAAPAAAPKKEPAVAAKKEDSKPAAKDSSSAPQKPRGKFSLGNFSQFYLALSNNCHSWGRSCEIMLHL